VESNATITAKKTVGLPAIVPIGKRAPRTTSQQQRGIWLHALLQYLTEGQASDEIELRQRLAIPHEEMSALWPQVQYLLKHPHLIRFFDPQQYKSAGNEMPYINAKGELKRIDRLVEFENEVWVLDYKLGTAKIDTSLSTEADAELTHPENSTRYRAQMQEYRTAMQTVYAGKKVCAALLYADGKLSEV
jgi:ATP-dependent helicase/nuclease subunit A